MHAGEAEGGGRSLDGYGHRLSSVERSDCRLSFALSLKLSDEKGEEICRVNKISVPLD